MFCSISVLSLASDSRSHLLECKNIHTAHTASNVHTASCVYPSRTPQQSDLAVYLVNSMEMYGQASLGIQLADDRFLICFEHTATLASRHTAVCTDAHLSTSYPEYTESIESVYFRAASIILAVSYWRYELNDDDKKVLTTLALYPQYVTPEYFQYRHYAPRMLRVPAVPAVSNPEILGTSGGINVPGTN